LPHTTSHADVKKQLNIRVLWGATTAGTMLACQKTVGQGSFVPGNIDQIKGGAHADQQA
jgi:hypothetical protein